MSNIEGSDKIYEELKGYFPPEYDLTPDELEKEIELENKKREIALGMMRPKLSDEKTQKADISSEGADYVASEKKAFEKSIPETDDIPKSYESKELFNDGIDDSDILDEELELLANAEDMIPAGSAAPFTDTDSFSVFDFEELFDAEEASKDKDESKVVIVNTEEPLPDATEQTEPDEDHAFKELFVAMESDSEEDEDKSKGEDTTRKTVSWIFDFLEILSVCITIIILIFALFARLTEVSGDSMVNTLHDGERLIVSNFMYEPKAGDIVVLQNTSIENETLSAPLVKRVIAVGGETVDITETGIVSVTDKNGKTKVLEQPYVYFKAGEVYRGSPIHCQVPKGYVFVMGDNRNYSADSRGPLGLVDERCIFGKAIARLLPLSEFEIFENPYNN